MPFLKGYLKRYWCVKHQLNKIHYSFYRGKARDVVLPLSGFYFCPQCIQEHLEGTNPNATKAALERVNNL